jgi:uncharacterized membrane protein YhaH (DUF805 family)
MYCRNCGSTISENAAVCLNCGVKAGVGRKFCPQCGAQPDPLAVICVKCGVVLNKHGINDTKHQLNDIVDDFGSAITTCFRKYATFSGRANKSEYWYWILFTVLLRFIPIINIISIVVLFIPRLSAAVRRLHDTGRSGAWVLVGFIPLVGWIWLIFLLCEDSVEGENEYGPNPNH